MAASSAFAVRLSHLVQSSNVASQPSSPAKRRSVDTMVGLAPAPRPQKAGRQRIADAQTVHGRDTKAERLERSRKSLELAQLEDAMYVLAMTSATRSRGRKPNG